MPGTLEAVVVLVFLIAPGFLCWTLISTHIPKVFVSDAHSLLVALLFSVVIHVLIAPISVGIAQRIFAFWQELSNVKVGAPVSVDWWVFIWALSVLFIVPILLSLILSAAWKAKWSQTILGWFGISQVQTTPSAWDWFFLTQERGCWVIAELKDGSRVGFRTVRVRSHQLRPTAETCTSKRYTQWTSYTASANEYKTPLVRGLTAKK